MNFTVGLTAVALHWIREAGNYKQLVSNRVSKIQQHSDVKSCHNTNQENPADLGRRGGIVQGKNLYRTEAADRERKLAT